MDLKETEIIVPTPEVFRFPGLLRAGLVCLAILVAHWAFGIFYNLFVHPLSKVPGPWTAAFSDIPFCRWVLGGRQPFKMVELHEKYGPAVRIAPNEVSFNSAQSWKDIYALKPGRQVFIKSDFYAGSTSATNGFTSIISERRPEVHKKMRTLLSSAFSDRAITEQEELVAEKVDKLVRLVGTRGSGGKPVDVSMMFESMTFDITCDLSFGEEFGALDMDKRHPWIASAVDSIGITAFVEIMRRFPAFTTAIYLMMRNKFDKIMADTKSNQDLCHKTIKRRMERVTDRKDFLTRILKDRDPKELPEGQMAAHASDLVIAGSDTTSTGLSAIVYYLLQNPATSAKLTAEIRKAFKQYSDINNNSTASLKYLRAVILEGMRLYPPAPYGAPRVVPEGGETVDGVFLPGGVIVSTHHLAAGLSSANFEDPKSFKPERWIKPEGLHIADSIQPWLLGPRGCIGLNLAWLELRTTIAKLFWVYDLEPVDPTLDWHKDSEGFLLWDKPVLSVHAKNRGVRVE
ncbi:benzoate 4-monooxygenase cytochrome P450 [Hypoxylon trugodes]|uniref:benzoate 4-monooxygenase cytochrome P450 n=1 Tax=Hypoxylon trugodes TaxID=326681 RepID=UPI00219031C7|nr:benzoate 4-monooxygenase cytochrome P450 [Hypoxylon trugodes]KAI1394149.1 benzoate 4-monooxygenase cytochrome P450 [Hypoxylon trugodes]